MEEKRRRETPNPYIKANCISRLLFWWTNQILQIGYHRNLDEYDLYEVLPEDSSVQLSNTLGREWEKEVYRHRTGGQPSLFTAILRGYGMWIAVTGLLFFLEECLRVGQILLLGFFISYFEPSSNLSTFEAYMVALGWSLSHLLVLVLDNLAFHRSFYLGLKMRVACTSLIYRKLIRLNHTSLQNLNTNGITMLFARDAQTFNQSCLGVNYIWIAPAEAIAIVYILWSRVGMGAYSLIGVLVVLVVTPIHFSLGKYLTKLREVMNNFTERRIRVVYEIFTGMWTIKVNSWEKAFSTLVSSIRRSEWVYLRALTYCRGFNSALYLCSGKLLMFAAFGTFIFSGHVLAPKQIFIALALYDTLRTNICLLMPWGVKHLQEALHAVQHLQQFLLMEERSVLETPFQLNILNVGRPPLPDEVALRFDDYTASWGKDNNSLSLEAINFSVQKGDMLAICGRRGSGKSSLFMGVLGEVPRLGGFIRTAGKVAYVPQHPWLFDGTLRENILFGKEMDRKRYHQALSCCVLLEDIDTFPRRDMTMVNEKELHLTEGQKAKICLARAVYHNADIYLVDDILNTLDEKTSVQVFTKCFCGILNTKTILYVTSDLNFIRAADHIIFMKGGQLVCQGMFEDIRNLGIDIRRELAEFGHNDESDRRMPIGANLDIDGNKKEDGYHMSLRQRLSMKNSNSEDSLDSVLLEFTTENKEGEHFLDKEKSGGQEFRFLGWRYLSAGAGAFGVITLLLISLLLQGSYVMCDWWLYDWMSKEHSVLSHQTLSPNSSITTTTPSSSGTGLRLTFYVYLAVFGAFLLLTFIRASLSGWVIINAAKTFHNKLFSSLMRAPMPFFEKNTVGGVLNRFTQDIPCIDDPLPASLSDCIQFLGLVAGTLVLMAAANVWLLIFIIPIVGLLFWLRHYYLCTAKEVKRLELSGHTPILQHLATTVEGLWSIRAFQNEDKFIQGFDTHQDHQTAASYISLAINRWFSLRIDFFSVTLLVVQAFISVLAKQYVNDALLCLSMAYAVNLLGAFQYAIHQSVELETQLSSVERVLSYTAIKPEGDLITSLRPALNWPCYGIITFEGTTVIDQEAAIKLLRNMWCCIRAQEKIGLMGETEDSKNAVVSVILRLKEYSGCVRIDGVDIQDIGLQDLREKITVIAKDPKMFGSSVRRNLDPMTKFPDAHLWKVLAEVQLKDKVERLPSKLYTELADVGPVFSLGERQLLGLARAILNNSKIIIFQESVSVIDKRTENNLLHLLKTKFENCTVVVLAQRLSTVIDMDRIMVLREGCVKEFDSAHILLQDKNGYVTRQHERLSSDEQCHLLKLAQEKYEEKPYRPPPQSLAQSMPPNMGMTYSYMSQNFLPSFQTSRISGVLNNFSGNRFSTNRF